MRAPRKSVGIDLGATAVRVVEVAGRDADSIARITRCAIVPLQPGAIVAGQIQDPNAVGWAVARAIKAAKVSPYGAVMGVSSSDTALTRLQLPAALKPAEWTKALRTADRQISPKLPLESSAVSMYPVPDASDLGNPHQRTLLAAATVDSEVEKVLAVARRSKVTPRAVDLSAAAMVRALTLSVPGNEDVATLVDIGYSKVTVATRQGLHLRSVRTFEGGGERVTRAVMGALGGTYDNAEEAKLTMRLSATAAPAQIAAPVMQAAYGALPTMGSGLSGGHDASHDALASSVTNLIEDIASAIEADAAAHPHLPTQGVVLCGGTSLLRGLREQLVQRVGVPAFIGRPWARVVSNKDTERLLAAGSEDPAVVLLSLATAVGLATWKDPR